jgi:hypothetical protein
MRSEGSIVVDRPQEEVFQLTNDHVEKWSIVVVENEVLDEKPGGVGTTFRTVTEERGKKMEFQGVVTRHTPPHLSAVHLTGSMFDIDVEYRFDDVPVGRTRVTQRSHVAAKGAFKIFLFLFGWMMKKSSCQALQKELNSLKQFCEQQTSPVKT